jgi:hypothetical protein
MLFFLQLASRPLTNEQHCSHSDTILMKARIKAKIGRTSARWLALWVWLYLLSESRILALPRVVQHVQTMFAMGCDIIHVCKHVFLSALGFLLFLHLVWVKIGILFPSCAWRVLMKCRCLLLVKRLHLHLDVQVLKHQFLKLKWLWINTYTYHF